MVGTEEGGLPASAPPAGSCEVLERERVGVAAFICLTHRVLFLNPSGNVSSIQRGVLACCRLGSADTS